MRVLVTRPEAEQAGTAAALARRGHEAVACPVTRIVGLSPALPAIDPAAVLITSARAILHASPTLRARLARCPAYVVGARTAAAAVAAGLRHVAATAPDAAALMPLIEASLPGGAPLVYLTGRERRPMIEQALGQRYPLHIVETYDAPALPELPAPVLAMLRAGQIDAVLHASPRAAAILARLATEAGVAEAVSALLHGAISEAAARAYGAPLTRPMRIARTPDREGLLATLDGA